MRHAYVSVCLSVCVCLCIMEEENMFKERDEYLQHLEDTGRKPYTIRGYRSSITQCIKLLDAYRRPFRAREIKPEDWYFLVSMMDGKESTVKLNVTIYAKMCEFFTGSNPLKKLNILWNRTTSKRVYITNEEFQELFAAATLNQKMVLILGAFLGMRRSEILNLKVSDIRGDTITIRGKGHGKGLEAQMRMSPEVKEFVRNYLIWRSQLPGEDLSEGKLLVFSEKKGFKCYKDPQSISTMMRTLRELTGIEFTPHSLRRLFATNLYKSGADLMIIQNLMRHASVETTMKCYIQSDSERMDQALCASNRTLSELLYT